MSFTRIVIPLRTGLALVSLLLGIGACAQPRMITGMTISGDQAKLIYAQARTLNTGMLQCKVATDGSLTDCKKINITFEEKKK